MGGRISSRVRSPFARTVITVLWCAGIALAAIYPMAIAGYPITHSTHFNLSWVFQFQAQVDGGQWYPRWLEYSNYGFGNPTFAFYPPLCMVATLPFHTIGLDIASSLVASMGLAVLVFVAGIYRYARTYYPTWIAAIAAGAAGSTPYLYVDIYQRGAIAEVWGIAIIPWLLWGSQVAIAHMSLKISPRPIEWNVVAGVAIAYGCLILSHLPTLLMVTCLWGLLPFFGPRHLKVVAGLFCSALLGGGWTAAYILPVLLDRRLIQVELLTALDDYRPENRLMLDGLLSLRPQLTHHWFDRSLLPLWLIAVVLVVGALLVRTWMSPQFYQGSYDRSRNPVGYWLLLSTISLLMTTDVLGWLYPIVLPLQTIQFSWRWMTVLCTTGPLLLGYQLDVARRCLQTRQRLCSAISFAFVLAICATNFALSAQALEQATYDSVTVSQFIRLAEAKVFPNEPIQQPQESFLHWHWLHPDGLGLVDVPEYRHHSASLAMPPTRPYPLLEWQEPDFTPGTEITLLRWSYGLRHFRATVSGEEPREIVLRTFFYPGWVTQLDKRPIQAGPNPEGQLQLSIPPGTHNITVRYRGTVAHRFGLWVSGCTVAGLAIGGAVGRSPSRRRGVR
ncbi:MAG: hypothetical protein AB4050_14455 [Synechococcus sp.]